MAIGVKDSLRSCTRGSIFLRLGPKAFHQKYPPFCVGGLGYSGVARVEERFREKCRKKSGKGREVEALLKGLTNVKG
jgi:hypothetical protein